jgi:hypothetical protein
MIILPTSSHKIIVALGGTPSGSPPNECHCYASYRETTEKSYEFGSNIAFSNGAAGIDLLTGPAAGIRAVDHISIYNPDAPSPTTDVTVIMYDGTNTCILVKQSLNLGETLTYNDKEGWKII